ncbi:Ger(x)C family spore germination protein [Paenibacillus caseinilyticus]|uniref:Germination protein Ger(X)C n=1 Tax=Paenibacillus mucilaginosus K02 TaxID=997761 RepID=I0BGK8_9BACL|nr:Ger(x)C family spore germination protein [Paenibacillus mucilaginosus]AFH61505.1 germination protein Ger(x)C [Paenibacillus mucilaginosus K02]
MKKRARLQLVLVLALLPLIAGCWNSRELRDLAIVVGMGIDKAAGGEGYRLSFQIMNPGSSSLGAKGGGGGDANTISVYWAEDKSLFGALRKASQKVPRQLFFAHIQLLVIGEPLAKEGLRELFDFYERSHELRLNTPVLVSRGVDAKAVLNLAMPLEPSSALGNAKRIRNTSRVWAHNAEMEVTDIIKSLNRSGSMVISGIKIAGDRRKGGTKANLEKVELPAHAEIQGMALFREGKWAGWVEGAEARGLIRVLDKVKGTIVTLPCGKKEDGISLEVIQSKTKVTYRIENGSPAFQIQVKEEGNLNEIRCAIDPSQRSEVVKLQKEWADAAKREIKKAVQGAQSRRSDYLGFDRIVESTDIKSWKNMEKNWPSLFAEAKVEVSVETFIRRTGMRSTPYLIKK